MAFGVRDTGERAAYWAGFTTGGVIGCFLGALAMGVAWALT